MGMLHEDFDPGRMGRFACGTKPETSAEGAEEPELSAEKTVDTTTDSAEENTKPPYTPRYGPGLFG